MRTVSCFRNKGRALFVAALVLIVLQAVRPWLGAAPADRSEAPRFEAESGNMEHLPLKATRVLASVDGVIARVEVEQEYANTGGEPIDATYVFPASTRAAVHGMVLETNGRVIEAKIGEKEKAASEFAAARREGKTAALLEEKRPNVFRMRVAAIRPGEVAKVRLTYSETLVSEEGVYEFVYPTVVAPRYNKPGEISSPVTTATCPGDFDAPDFSLALAIHGGGKLRDVTCATHPSEIAFPSPDQARVRVRGTENDRAENRDVVVRYRLGGESVTNGVLLHTAGAGGHFLITIEPPARPETGVLPPRDYIFVVDTSGSMNGFPLDTAKSLMRGLLGDLRVEDRFNIIAFAGGNAVFSPDPRPAEEETIGRAMRWLDRREGGGGTELRAALDKALAMPGEEGRARVIVTVTDGLISGEAEVFELVRAQLGRANFFAFGIGSSVNRHLIEGLARAGKGEPAVVLHPGEAAATSARFRRQIERPVLTDIRIEWEGFAVEAVEPVDVPDLFAERPLRITGKFAGDPKGKLHVRGRRGGEKLHAVIDIAEAAASGTNHPAVPILWARERVGSLLPNGEEKVDPRTREEVLSIGLEYALLTPFTSFVAVDHQSVPTGTEARAVVQPLPLPHLVSVSAIGGGSVPEPGVAALLLATFTVLLFQRRR